MDTIAPASALEDLLILEIAMQPVQYYTTTIQDNSSSLAFSFVTVPDRSLPSRLRHKQLNSLLLPGRLPFQDPLELAEALGLEPRALIYLASWQQFGENLIADLIVSEANPNEVWLPNLRPGQEPTSPVPAAVSEFAHFLSNEPIVPFESSPLTAAAIKGLIEKSATVTGGGVMLGAFAGLVQGYESGFMLLTLPAGMILGGTAAAVGRALEHGLGPRLLRLIGAAEASSDVEKTDAASAASTPSKTGHSRQNPRRRRGGPKDEASANRETRRRLSKYERRDNELG